MKQNKKFASKNNNRELTLFWNVVKNYIKNNSRRKHNTKIVSLSAVRWRRRSGREPFFEKSQTFWTNFQSKQPTLLTITARFIQTFPNRNRSKPWSSPSENYTFSLFSWKKPTKKNSFYCCSVILKTMFNFELFCILVHVTLSNTMQ